MIRSKFIFTFQMGFQIQIQGFGSFLNKLSNQREFERFRKKKTDYFRPAKLRFTNFYFSLSNPAEFPKILERCK